MFRFFRRNKSVIIWVMIAMFVGTICAGLGFTGINKLLSKDKPKINGLDDGEWIAKLGELQVPMWRFDNQFRRLLNAAGDNASPEIIEKVRQNALIESVRFTIMLEEAKKRDYKVSGADLRSYINAIVVDLGIKNKNALKKALSKQNIPYKVFEDHLKEDIYVNKFDQSIAAGISVSDQDIENIFKEVHARHILIRPKSFSIDDLNKAEAKKVEEQLTSWKQGITAGQEDFELLAKKYSVDTVSAEKGGDLGWVGFGMMVPEFQNVAFSLGIGDISYPLRTQYGYHLIQVLDIRYKEKPIGFDKEKARQLIMKDRKDAEINKFMENYNQRNYEIKDNWINAIRFRNEQKYDEAINQYRIWSGKNSSSSLPQYYIAQIETTQGKLTEAIDTYKRAILLSELSSIKKPMPELYLALAKLQFQQKQTEDSKATLTALLEFYKEDKRILDLLKTSCLEYKFKDQIAEIETCMLAIDAKQVSANQTAGSKSELGLSSEYSPEQLNKPAR